MRVISSTLVLLQSGKARGKHTASAVQARRDCSRRDTERLRHIVVPEVAEGNEQKNVSVVGRQRSECSGKAGSCLPRVNAFDKGVLIRRRPLVDAAARKRTQPPLLSPAMPAQQIRRDPKQPRARVRRHSRPARSCLEGDPKRLASEFVRDIPAGSPVQIPVDSHEVPIEDGSKGSRIRKRATDRRSVRGIHRRALADALSRRNLGCRNLAHTTMCPNRGIFFTMIGPGALRGPVSSSQSPERELASTSMSRRVRM
jgi:hypothetical protein